VVLRAPAILATVGDNAVEHLQGFVMSVVAAGAMTGVLPVPWRSMQ